MSMPSSGSSTWRSASQTSSRLACAEGSGAGPRPSGARAVEPLRERSTSSISSAVARSRIRALDHGHAVLLGRARRSSPGCAGSRRAGRGTCPCARTPPVDGVPDVEVRPVDLLVLDLQDGVDDERAFDLGRHEAGHEMDALDHHRPAFGERALDRRLDADEHVARLVEEAVDHRVAVSAATASPASKLE